MVIMMIIIIMIVICFYSDDDNYGGVDVAKPSSQRVDIGFADDDQSVATLRDAKIKKNLCLRKYKRVQ